MTSCLFPVLGRLLVALAAEDPSLTDVSQQNTATEPPAANDANDAAAGASEVDTYGVAVGVGFASSYVFRGLNLLQSDSQQNVHAVVQPSLEYEIPDTGATVAYFASYQITGANRSARVADGTGDEQDLSVAWSRSVGDLEVGTSLAAYVYPFADAEAAGTRVPVYLEPLVGATLSTAVDLGFAASLMAGLQPALRPSNYIYLNPSVSRTFELSERVALDASSSYGHKLQRESDNTHDVALDLGVTISPTDRLDVTPGVHWAWTNLRGRDFVDEQVLWASMNVGARL